MLSGSQTCCRLARNQITLWITERYPPDSHTATTPRSCIPAPPGPALEKSPGDTFRLPAKRSIVMVIPFFPDPGTVLHDTGRYGNYPAGSDIGAAALRVLALF
jgi:hypothetical protein